MRSALLLSLVFFTATLRVTVMGQAGVNLWFGGQAFIEISPNKGTDILHECMNSIYPSPSLHQIN